MQDDYVSKSAVLAIGAWVLAIGLLGSVWIYLGVAEPDPVTMDALIATAIICSVGAAVWQIKLYVSRLSALIRITAGLKDKRPKSLQSIR